MAEALILHVLGKIGAIVAEEAIKSLYSKFKKEVSLLKEVRGRIEQIDTEFKFMKAFLSQTETIELNNIAFKTLLQEVREVAHEVEDVLDEYAYITGELCSRSTRWFKRKFYKSESIVSLHAIANQLKGFETRLQKISDMRSQYDIKFQGENSSIIVSKIQKLIASSSYLIDRSDNILRGINSVSLRSFISFDTTLNLSLSRLSSFITGCKYLRVLDLQETQIEQLPDGVTDLFNLHHLGLRFSNIQKLPESIGRLHNLQTLDLRGTEVEKLPHGVTELKNLRHLLVGSRHNEIKAPDGLAELKNLQTLKGVIGSKKLVRGLGNLTQLRSLHIHDVANFVELCTSIVKMPFLSSLLIRSEEESFLSVGLDHPLQHLEKLSLEGRLQGEISSTFFCSLGNSLQKLRLSHSTLREDPLPSLFHLSNLTSLELGFKSYLGQQLWFRRGWFPNLTNLKLWSLPKLEKVEIENGALQSLEYLYLGWLVSLVSVPSGIEFLTTLKVLELRGVRIKEADNSKISHIPTIHYYCRHGSHTNLSLLLKKGRG